MVDNRSAGFFGIGGAFNFKSGDISGTAANTQDDKMGPGTEYGAIPTGEEEQQGQQYVDRSAQLRATLNSLAMMNVANVLNEKKKLENLVKKSPQKSLKHDLDEEFINDYEDDLDDDEVLDLFDEDEDDDY